MLNARINAADFVLVCLFLFCSLFSAVKLRRIAFQLEVIDANLIAPHYILPNYFSFIIIL